MPDPIAKLLLENVHPRPGRGAWHGGPTSFGSLRGVSAKQAEWVPAPGRKSIWQLVLHIAYWNYAVRRRLEGGDGPRFPRTPADWPRLPEQRESKSWSQDVALLSAEHERIVAAVAKIPSSKYKTILAGGKQWTIGELIVGIAQHDAYHTGQIQMLKRLWTASRSVRPVPS
ncbi:MAG: DinB family protein [Gemmatimonadaceae bacterium]